jgi:hypothetical protein
MYMPALLYQVITLVFDLSVIVFVVFYVLGVRRKEKEVDRKEGKIDADYKAVVDNTLAQERHIIENAVNQSNQMMQIATHQANQILAGTQYISQTSKATLDNALQGMMTDVSNTGSSSKISLEQALQKIVIDVHKEAFDTGREFTNSYSSSLKQITTLSLSGFQNITNELELELQQQIKDFRQNLLANLEKEVESYKQQKIRRIDQASHVIVQQVAQEVLNKSLSLDDHQNLVIQSLEKAKKEGIFD